MWDIWYEAVLGQLACCNWLSCGHFFRCLFPSIPGMNKSVIFQGKVLYYKVLFHSLGISIFFRQEPSVFSQFCLTPMQNFTLAVFSPTFNRFPTIYQLLTRNVSQKCSPYWFLVSVSHLLGLCSPFSTTFYFIFPT